MSLYALYCTYDMLNMFRARLCPSSGALDYMCVITSYGVPCSAAAASLFLYAQPAALHLTPDKQQPSTAHHRRQIHTYSLELLIMGIEVPETC